MYKLIKQVLFKFDPERAHRIALVALNFCYQLGLTKLLPKIPANPIKVMGLDFPNRVGLAAGMDKHGDYIDALAALGFGFIEIGGVTPKPQAGNPRPRLFRLINQQAIINRFNFNSKGIDHLVERLKKMRYRGIIGVNIAKNNDTPNEHAVEDYLICMRALWPYASYIVINISCPNTPGLGELQKAGPLANLLTILKKEQLHLQQTTQKYVPLVVKVSPDLADDQIDELADTLLAHNIEGVIATNTTRQRLDIADAPQAQEAGGLSGKPICELSTHVIKRLHDRLQDRIPIIASGGIMDAKSAQEKINAGAQLVQVLTGFVYEGPRIIGKVNAATIE